MKPLAKPDAIYAIVGLLTVIVSVARVPELLGLTAAAVSYIGAAVIAVAGVVRLLIAADDPSRSMLMDASAIAVAAIFTALTASGFTVLVSPNDVAALGGSVGIVLATIRGQLAPAPPT
jgi:selenophosphate synthetase-related protein